MKSFWFGGELNKASALVQHLQSWTGIPLSLGYSETTACRTLIYKGNTPGTTTSRYCHALEMHDVNVLCQHVDNVAVGYHKTGYPNQEGKRGKKRIKSIGISSKTRAISQLVTRPSPGLERNRRLARAPASSAISASPEPQPRAQSTPRSGPGLECNQRLTRASASAPGFSRTVAVPLT